MCGQSRSSAGMLRAGKHAFCGPTGSECHRLWLRTKDWKLAPQDAHALLERDIATFGYAA
jgi:hypothetical protein